MRLGIVGAGRVGTALAVASARAGVEITAVASRTTESVRRVMRLAGLHPSVECERPDQVFGRSDVLLLSVSDSAIEEVCTGIAEAVLAAPELNSDITTPERPRRIVAHLSGALSSSVLSPLRELGASVASLHPIKSFSTDPEVSSDFRGVVATVEGDEEAAVGLEQLATSLGMVCARIRSDMKPLYHAAACVASNYTVTLFALSLRMMELCGMESELARRALSGLVGGTARNLQSEPPETALTGPISRGDVQTVREHLAVLGQLSDARVESIYRLLGAETVELAMRGRRLTSESATGLLELLSAEDMHAGSG